MIGKSEVEVVEGTAERVEVQARGGVKCEPCFSGICLTQNTLGRGWVQREDTTDCVVPRRDES